MIKPFELPKDFLMGSATASIQIEGGDDKNNWYRWCKKKGNIKDGTNCYTASDHYNRYEEDIQLMKETNHEVYRMSIEWSRIEPERGKFNPDAIKFYINVITALKKNNIRPIVTLYHFSHPIWFEDMGAWENSESVSLFLEYVQKVVTSLGHLVNEWISINEPNVYLQYTYIDGNFPPGKVSILNYFKAAKNLIKAHLQTYELIHKSYKENDFKEKAYVGVAHHAVHFDLADNSHFSKLSRVFFNHCFHNLFFEGMTKGKMLFPLAILPFSKGKKIYSDFFGINYYSRYLIKGRFHPQMLLGELLINENGNHNDMGWEIYPEGLYKVCKNIYKKYNLPIFITENGIPDAKDEKRSRFIIEHLWQIRRLLNENIPIQRYYHWSLLDNFEWDHGLTPRFGIIHVDYNNNQTRRLRDSGKLYGKIIKNKKITEEMLKKHYNPDYS